MIDVDHLMVAEQLHRINELRSTFETALREGRCSNPDVIQQKFDDLYSEFFSSLS